MHRHLLGFLNLLEQITIGSLENIASFNVQYVNDLEHIYQSNSIFREKKI